MPKAELLRALEQAPCVEGLSQGGREAFFGTHAKLKKDELAARVAAALEGNGYLPDLLVTPVGEGAHELTAAGDEAVAT
ncbi:MAG: hypothetical protein Q8R02_03565 [Hyphomonadaceae bacterium]|nr:hypothetical protein [Hyphomonadaceae bacterium]